MKSLLIKNGHVLSAVDSFDGDILVENGKIRLLGKHLDVIEPAAQVIDASGLYVLPGGIDVHVHMELPVGGGLVSSDNFETGTRAAIAGGTTSIIDFVTPEPGQPLMEALNQRKEAAKKSLCDYGLHMSITSWNDRIPGEMRRCVEQEGISSFKVYMAYKGAVGLDDDDLIRVMDTAAKLGARVMIHCEHDEVIRYLQKKFTAEGKMEPKYHPLSRPPEAEREAVVRALMMAKQTGCPLYIVHISTSAALSETTNAQLEKQDVMVETCPHYLLLDEREYHRPGFEGAAYVMSPPLRTKQDKRRLWKHLHDGHIQVTATDHCPFHMKNGKDRGMGDFTKIPNGVAGVENRMGLLYTYGVLKKRISLNRWAAVTSTLPAKIFGLYPRKGAIVPGADADLVLWNPRAKGTISADTHFQNCDTNIYEGFSVKGKPHAVILNGKIAFEEGLVKVEKDSGRYLHREIKRS